MSANLLTTISEATQNLIKAVGHYISKCVLCVSTPATFDGIVSQSVYRTNGTSTFVINNDGQKSILRVDRFTVQPYSEERPIVGDFVSIKPLSEVREVHGVCEFDLAAVAVF